MSLQCEPGGCGISLGLFVPKQVLLYFVWVYCSVSIKGKMFVDTDVGSNWSSLREG